MKQVWESSKQACRWRVELRAAGEKVGQSGLLELFKFKNQNHISKVIPACPALVLFSIFSSNTVWIKGRH